jgi:hypothetical protein
MRPLLPYLNGRRGRHFERGERLVFAELFSRQAFLEQPLLVLQKNQKQRKHI